MLCSFTLGQDTPRSPGDRGDFVDGNRPNLMQALNLTKDQLRVIRSMNRDRRPVMEQAQIRLRRANRELDAAIYSDSFDEGDFERRLSEFQNAQAEIVRIRFENELQLRKVLTPEQLVRFRVLRERVSRAREQMRNKDVDQDKRPLRQRIRELNRSQKVN